MSKRQNFQLGNPSVTTTYAGEFAGKYISAALFSAKTLDNKYVTIMPNVKYKQVIQKVQASSIVTDASCDFVNSGSIALTERILEPKELQVNLSLCKQEFVDSWESLQLGFSAFDTIPANFNDYLVSYVSAFVAEQTETSIWQGNSATNGQFGGFERAFSASLALSSSTSVIAAGATSPTSHAGAISGSVTSANVLSKLDSAVNSIPDEVYGKEDLLIYVSTNVAKAYQQALAGGAVGANGWNNQLNVGEKPFNFNGIEIVHCPGLSANKFAIAQSL